MDGGAWWAAVHEVAKSQTWPSNFTLTFHFHALEKGMATHSSVLAWRIPGMEPGGLPSMGSHRVGHDWSDLAAAVTAVVKNSSRALSEVYQKPGNPLCKEYNHPRQRTPHTRTSLWAADPNSPTRPRAIHNQRQHSTHTHFCIFIVELIFFFYIKYPQWKRGYCTQIS